MHDIRLVISAAVLALGAYISPASADGMPKGPSRDRFPCCGDVEYREYNWSGVFVGGHVAGAISHSDFFLTTPTDGFRHNETSFGGGVQGAAQYQWGRLVAGVETSFTWIDFDASRHQSVCPARRFRATLVTCSLSRARLAMLRTAGLRSPRLVMRRQNSPCDPLREV